MQKNAFELGIQVYDLLGIGLIIKSVINLSYSPTF